MTITTSDKATVRSRAGVRRTVLILAGCALASYALFLYSVWPHK
jgi:hypothetical protein